MSKRAMELSEEDIKLLEAAKKRQAAAELRRIKQREARALEKAKANKANTEADRRRAFFQHTWDALALEFPNAEIEESYEQVDYEVFVLQVTLSENNWHFYLDYSNGRFEVIPDEDKYDWSDCPCVMFINFTVDIVSQIKPRLIAEINRYAEEHFSGYRQTIELLERQ